MGTSMLLRSMFIIAAISVIATLSSALTVEAQVNPFITWTGDGENNLWSNPDNWSTSFSPTFSGSSSRIIIPAAFDDTAKGNVEVVMDIEKFTIKDGGQFTNNGNLTISVDSTLIVEPNRINGGGSTPDITVFLNHGLLTNLGKLVIKDKFDNYLVMINKGTIEIGGRVTFEGTPQEGILRNYFELNNFGGQITNDGKLHGLGLMFFNNGTITNNGELKNGDTGIAIAEVGWQLIINKIEDKDKRLKILGQVLPTLDKLIKFPRTQGSTIQNEGTINNNGVFKNEWNVEFGDAVSSLLRDIKIHTAYVPSGVIEVPEFPTPTVLDNRGTINISSSILDNGSVLKNSGTINNGDGGTLLNIITGRIQSSGTINSLSSSSKIVNAGNFEITGVLKNGGGSTTENILRDSITKIKFGEVVTHNPSFENRGKLTITGTFNNYGVLSNFKNILIENGGTFNNLDYGVLIAVDFLTQVTVERDGLLFNVGKIQLGLNNDIFGAGPIGQIRVFDGFFLNSGTIKAPGGLHITIGKDVSRSSGQRGGTGISYCSFDDGDAISTKGTGTYNRDFSCTMTFTGAGGDQKWSNPLNWDKQHLGTTDGDVRISSTARMNQDVFFRAGTITINPGSHLIVDTGTRFSIMVPTVVFTNNGAFTVSPLALFDSIGTTNNNGVVTNKGYMTITNQFNNQGTLVNDIQGFRAGDGSFSVQNPAPESDENTIVPARLFNQGEINSSGTITNHGLIVNENRIINTNTLDNDGYFLIKDRGTVKNTGTITNTSPEPAFAFECDPSVEECRNYIGFGNIIVNKGKITNDGTIHNVRGSIDNLDGATISGSGNLINESHIKNTGPRSSIVQFIVNTPPLFQGEIINACGNLVATVIQGKPVFNSPCVFRGGGDGVSWSDPNNWNNKILPSQNDVVIETPVHLDTDVLFVNNRLDIRGSLTIDPGSKIRLSDSTINIQREFGSIPGGELINKGKIEVIGNSKLSGGLFENHCGGLSLGTLEFVAATSNSFFVKIPCVWDGGGDGISWSDPNNWETDKIPGDGDIVIIDGDDSKDSTVNGISHISPLFLGGKIIVDEGDTLQDMNLSIGFPLDPIIENSALFRNNNFGIVENDGTIVISTYSTIRGTLESQIINNGILKIEAPLIFYEPGILINNGIIENLDTFWMGGDSIFLNQGTINNEKGFFISPTDLFLNPGQFEQSNFGEIINNGEMLLGNLFNGGSIIDNCRNIRIEGSFSGNPVTGPDSIDNPCSVSWDGEAGDGLWSNPDNWIDNTLPTGSDYIVIDSDTTVDSTVHLDIAFTLTTGSLLINLGDSLIVDSAGLLVNNSPDTIQNLGTLVVNGELVNNEDGTIENDGTISNNGAITNTGTITSNGVIENNLDATILNDIGSEIEIADGKVINDGTITNFGSISNTGDIINNEIILNHKSLINNQDGTIVNEKTLEQFSNLVEGPELVNFGTITNNDSIVFTNTITNHGILENFGSISIKEDSGSSNLRFSTFVNHGILNNHGTYNIGDIFEKNCFLDLLFPLPIERCDSKGTIDVNVKTFDNQGTITNTGQLNIGDGRFVNPGIIVNEGQITNSAFITMFGGVIDNNGGTITNSGYMFLTHGTSVNDRGTINNNGGIINNDGTRYHFPTGFDENGVRLPPPGCFDIELPATQRTRTLCSDTLERTNETPLAFGPGSTIHLLGGSLNNLGTINNHFDARIGNYGNTIVNDGVINNDGDITPEGDFINNCDGVIEGEGVNNGVFDNCDFTPPGFTSINSVIEEATSVDGAIVSYELPEITDNKDPNPTIECTPESESQFPIGISEITCTASDSFDNTSTITQLVIVIDSPPILDIPEDVEVDATSEEGTEVFFDVSATDLIDGPVTPICEPESGSLFPVGETTVTCTATDLADNAAQGTFTVTVVDATPPTTCTLPEVLINGECVDTTPTDPTSLEHYLSYKAKQPKGDEKFVKFTVTLDDKYESATYTVDKPDRLFNPVDKNNEGLTDVISHYVGYKIKEPKGDDKFEHIKNVSVSDQFGELTIDIKKPKLLLVPSAKDHTQVPDMLNPVTVNHFKCYDVKESKGTDKFEKLTVTVNDPNFVITQEFEIKKPKMLCIPVDKNGEGFVSEENNLTCYDVKNLKGADKFEKRNVFTNNQFGPDELQVDKQEELCVPSKFLP